MSGRLVILRHKSWHVWNQDNQEKVLRDERLEKEKEEESKSKNRELLQEQQREVLLKTSSNSSSHQDIHDSSHHEKFCLFDDPESIKVAQRENEEYMRETKEKERNIRKREGVADWSLSEGNTIVPWYSKAPIDPSMQQILNNSSSSSSNSNVHNCDIDKKRAALDPASKFMTPYLTANAQDSVKSDEANVAKMKSEAEKNERTSGKLHEIDKNEKRTKKEKKKEKKEHKKHKKQKTTHSSVEESISTTTTNEADKDESMTMMMMELRQRRLERERLERHRTAIMLAERDIYGSSRSALAEHIHADSRGHNYNQRYNPALSRN